MPINHSTQPTLKKLKQSIRALAKSPRNQSRVDLSRKLELLDRRQSSEFHDLIHEGTLNRRTAYYLRDVGRLIRIAKLSTSQAERIGRTKLQIIGKKMNGKNLKLAEKNNVQELKRLIGEDSRRSKPHCVLLYFGKEQYRQFRQAMVRHGASRWGRGLIGKEKAILRIIRRADV
jgi:DNA-binding transcriptional MocR family regulator